MIVLKRSRRLPEAGDIFVYRIKGHPFGYGRVIRTGTRIGDFTDVVLLYIYRSFSMDKLKVPGISKRRLLIPPLGTNRRPWTMGYFETIACRPLDTQDVLPVHCFRDDAYDRYVNENGIPLKKKSDPCGVYGLDSFRTIDARISYALGIKPAPDTVP